MIKQKSGKIIPITSTAGQRGESLHTHYGASKGGVISLMKGLATELARHNILVNSVAPGWVATDMSNPVTQTKAGGKSHGVSRDPAGPRPQRRKKSPGRSCFWLRTWPTS